MKSAIWPFQDLIPSVLSVTSSCRLDGRTLIAGISVSTTANYVGIKWPIVNRDCVFKYREIHWIHRWRGCRVAIVDCWARTEWTPVWEIDLERDARRSVPGHGITVAYINGLMVQINTVGDVHCYVFIAAVYFDCSRSPLEVTSTISQCQ